MDITLPLREMIQRDGIDLTVLTQAIFAYFVVIKIKCTTADFMASHAFSFHHCTYLKVLLLKLMNYSHFWHPGI